MDQYADTEIELGKEYEFQITSGIGDIIYGTTIPFPHQNW